MDTVMLLMLLVYFQLSSQCPDAPKPPLDALEAIVKPHARRVSGMAYDIGRSILIRSAIEIANDLCNGGGNA